MILTSDRVSISSLQAVGLQIGIRWLKFFWNGWLSRNHVTQLPVLDECIDCLNTGHVMVRLSSYCL